jgi:hypothetical protein
LEIGCFNHKFRSLVSVAKMDDAIDNGVLPVSLHWCQLCPEWREPEPPDIEAENEKLLAEVERERWGSGD